MYMMIRFLVDGHSMTAQVIYTHPEDFYEAFFVRNINKWWTSVRKSGILNKR